LFVNVLAPARPLRRLGRLRQVSSTKFAGQRFELSSRLYGNEAAYQRYQNLKIQSQMEQRAEMSAEANEAAAEEMSMPPPFSWH
jgi:hypothetical protein